MDQDRNPCSFRAENDAEIRTQRQKDKIDRLHAQSTHKEVAESLQNVMHNSSHKTLSKPAQTALAKGFNFAIALAHIPVESSVEAAIQKLDSDTSETIHQDVTAILRRAKPSKRNITRQEFLALKELQKDNYSSGKQRECNSYTGLDRLQQNANTALRLSLQGDTELSDNLPRKNEKESKRITNGSENTKTHFSKRKVITMPKNPQTRSTTKTHSELNRIANTSSSKILSYTVATIR